jgi:hypothetical protein
LDTIAATLFMGDSTSLATLKSLLQDGRLLSNFTPSDSVLQATIGKSLYTMMIPVAWSIHGDFPVLIDNNWDCSHNPGTVDWIKTSDQAAAKVCVDNKLYYLLQVNGKSQTCAGGCAATCQNNPLSLVTGADNISPTNNPWNNVTTSWIVTR